MTIVRSSHTIEISTDDRYLVIQLVKAEPVLFFDFKHMNKYLINFITEVWSNQTEFLKDRLDSDLVILEIIYILKIFLEDNLNQHHSQSKNVGF